MSKCKYCDKKFTDKRRPNSITCPSCRVSKRRWKSKIELIEQLGNKCNRCNFEGHPGVFHFHHKNPSDKKFEINGNKLLTKDRHIEIKKCELLCANCHQIEHSNSKLIKKFGFNI